MKERNIVRGGTPIVSLANRAAFQQEASAVAALAAGPSGGSVPHISIKIVPAPAAEGPRPAEPSAEGPRPAEPAAEGPRPAEPSAEGPRPAEPAAEGPRPAEPAAEGPRPAEKR